MAHFAKLDQNNRVEQVVVIDNATIDDLPFPESEPVGIAFCQSLYGEDTVWAQTSYSASFRYNYASEGYTYDSLVEAFISPKPYPSWLLDTNTYVWTAPIPYPNDGKAYVWDEATQSWVDLYPA
jgi:hypothetical protein